MYSVIQFVRVAVFSLLLSVGSYAVALGQVQERIVVQDGRFVFEQSGDAFRPYGVNYCRLDNKWHSVFSIGCYDAERFETMLADMQQNNLNVVRIFLDHRNDRKGSDGAGGGIATDGFELSREYVANMIDGLERARKHSIYVILCLNGQLISPAVQELFAEPVSMVENDRYPISHPMCSLGNMKFFHPGALEARGEYFKRVVQAIADHDASLLSTVFSYELENESYFVGKAPLNLRSGTFRFLGRDYDLSQDRELRRLMDDAAVHWADRGAMVIRSVDPKAMVSVNVFTYKAVGRKNLMAVRPDQGGEWDKKQRIPVNLKALAASTLDYLDVHIYLRRIGESSVAEKLEETLGSIDFDGLSKAARESGKPLIVGEYAAFKDKARSLEQQAQDVAEQMDLFAEKGLQGFLYWTYDTDEQPQIHNLKMNDGRMLDVMTEWIQFSGTANCFEKETIKVLADRVRTYQIDQGLRFKNQHWVRGTYYAGLMAMYESTSDRAYLDDCMNWGKQVAWRIKENAGGKYESGSYPLICGQIWYGCYQSTEDESMIQPTIEFLNNPNKKTTPVSEPKTWYFENDGRRFVDGLFTAPPALAMLYEMTGDEKYVNWMDACFWDVHGEIFDSDAGLFNRDARSKSHKTWNGKKVLWSRGNGWAFGGVTRILKHLPKDHGSYARYQALYIQMAESLATRQQDDGFWRPNLDDPEQYNVRESSGTGFFTYGIAWGINNGILDRERFLPVVKNGWAALASVVNEEGAVTWNQPPGGGPGMVKETDSTEYGSGIFLLAASEIYLLTQ